MLTSIISVAGAVLFGAGYFWLQIRRGQGAISVSVLLMGAGALLLLLPGYRLSVLTTRILAGLPERDKKLSDLLTDQRLRALCIAAGIVGIAGLAVSPDGVNSWTMGFFGLAAASGLIYAAAHSVLGGPGAFGNVALWFVKMGGFCGLVVSIVTLISQLSGASDTPTRWNVYSLYGLLGLGASVYAIYYGLYYETDLEVVELLKPLGFTLAESGPLGRDGKYDARGVWKGIETLVNVSQSDGYKSSPPGFFLEISCAAPGWAGRRLLVHPKGYLQRPLGTPLFLPSAPGIEGWGDFGVYCDPPAAAADLLAVMSGCVSPIKAAKNGFSYFLLDKGRLAFGFSREGHPSREYLRRMLDLAASAAEPLA